MSTEPQRLEDNSSQIQHDIIESLSRTSHLEKSDLDIQMEGMNLHEPLDSVQLRSALRRNGFRDLGNLLNSIRENMQSDVRNSQNIIRKIEEIPAILIPQESADFI